MKNLIKPLLFIFLLGAALVACKDNFSEQDLLTYQANALSKKDSLNAAKQVAAMNDAGLLLSYTLQVLDDKTPISGVAVTMTNQSTTAGTATGTTDANGFATFKSVQIGANTVVISKTGYYAATFIVDFGTPTAGVNYTTTTNTVTGVVTVIPIKKTASNQVPLFASGSGSTSTATIKGTVTIETDLTNSTPEIPQGLTIKANLASVTGNSVAGNGSSTGSGTSNQSTITTYFFNTNAIGTATVDNTTGAYSMIVPAGADGRTLTMIYPVVNANQKIGFNKLNGVVGTAQISSTVPAVFGPSTIIGNATYDAIPSISGVAATFSPSAPPAAGSGLSGKFTPWPRTLGSTGVINSGGDLATPTQWSNVTYQLTNRGAGYSTSPTVTLTGGGATTQAVLTTSLSGTLINFTITNGGTNYTGNVVFTLQQSIDGTNWYNVYDLNGNGVNFSKDVGTTATSLSSVTIPLPTTGTGFSTNQPFYTSYWGSTLGFAITNFRLVISGGGSGSGAIAAPTVSCSVDQVRIVSAGSGYTAAPTISIAAPGSGTQAVLSILEFGTQWTVAMDNSGSNSSYKVLPSNVQLVFNTLNAGTFTGNTIFDQFGTNYGSIINNLTVSSGNVVFQDQLKTYYTSSYSQSTPSLLVTASTAQPALANITVNSTLGGAAYGQITTFNVSQQGLGYDVIPTVTVAPITGLTGSSAKIDLTSLISFNSTSKTYSVNTGNATISAAGSSYQPFANMYYTYYNNLNNVSGITSGNYSAPGSAVPFIGPTTVTVKTGDVQVYDIYYGTGAKKQNVN